MSKEIKEHIEAQELKNWKIVALSEVANVGHKANEASFPSKNTFIPFIPMDLIPDDKIFIDKWEMRPFNKIKSGVLVQEGDLLLAKITPSFENGKQGILKNLPQEWAYATTEVHPIRPKDENILNIVFLAFYFKQPNLRKKLASKMEGTTGRQRLPKSVIKSLPIPLPPLPEQKAIAFVLRSVQEAKEATEKVISSLRELKKSLMKHLFTYGPVPINQKSQVKLKETEVGQIPEHWEVVKLKEVTKFMKAGGTPKRSETKFWRGNIPFVLVRDLTSCGIYLNKTEETITEEGLNNSSAWLVPPRSLLLSMYATIGETAVNTIPVATNQAILALIPNDTFHVEFGAYLLKFHSKRLAKYNVQSTQKNINKGIVKNFPIPLPPIEEQEKMAEILKAVDEKIEAEEKRKEALESLFKSLLNNLMTAKIRLPEEFIKKFEEESNELRK